MIAPMTGLYIMSIGIVCLVTYMTFQDTIDEQIHNLFTKGKN